MFGILLLVLLALFYVDSGSSVPIPPPPYAPSRKEEKETRTIIIIVVVVAVLVIVIASALAVYFFGLFKGLFEGYDAEVSILDKFYTHCIKGDYGWDNETPANGSIFLILGVKVKNTGTKDIYVSIYDFTLSDTTGRTYSVEYSPVLDNQLEGADVQPGNYNSGKICFEILEISTPKTLHFSTLFISTNTTITGSILHVDYVE